MNREYFLRELEYLLMDISEEERQEALQYYQDYLEDAGLQSMEEITAKLGSPAKVAAEIRDSLSGQRDGGEFTERGYQDDWYVENKHVPDQYAEVKKNSWRESANRRRNGILLIFLIIFFGLPLAGSILSAGFSLAGAIAAALFGGFAGIFALIIGLGAVVFGLMVAGVALIIGGCAAMSVPAVGVMIIGWGFLILSAGFLLAILTKWAGTTVVPSMVRFCTDIVKKGIDWVRDFVCRIRKRGGANS